MSIAALWTNARILVIPTISAFLCFLPVVISPWSALGGEYAFLVYTSLLLFFFPCGKIIAQIEDTILGILGAVCGLLWSCGTLAIASYCGRKYGSDSDTSRGVIGVGLAVLSLICGFLRSCYPSLTVASRIALFFPIFLLTAQTGVTSMKWSFFTEQFLVTCFAAAFALIPTLLLSYQSSSSRLGRLVLHSLRETSELLPLSLSSVLENEDTVSELKTARSNQIEQGKLAQSLRSQVSQMQPVYDEYTLEITRGRSHPTALKPLIGSIKRLHRNPLLGPTSHVPGDRIKTALERTYEERSSISPTPLVGGSGANTPRRSLHDSAGRNPTATTATNVHKLELQNLNGTLSVKALQNRSYVWADGHRRMNSGSGPYSTPLRPTLILASKRLAQAINSALQRSSVEIVPIFGWYDIAYKDQWGSPNANRSSSLRQVKIDLENAVSELQRRLTSLLDGLNTNTPPASSRPQSPSLDTHHSQNSPNRPSFETDPSHERDHFRLAFYLTALLDLAKDVLDLLTVVMTITARADAQKRWHIPRLSWLSWEKISLTQLPISRGENTDADNNEEDDAQTGKSISRISRDKAFEEMDFVTAMKYQSRQPPQQPQSILERLNSVWRRGWDDRRVISGRILLSRLLHGLRHSRHVLFSLKLAGGISLLALPAFLPPGTQGRKWFDKSRGAWTVISYMYVLEVHTGATLKVGLFRLIGTFFGALTAYVFTLIAHDNPYALVVLATIASVPLSYLILLSSYPQIGTVAGITLPPLLFLSYLDLAHGQSNWQLAWTRFVDITIGIASAVLVGSLIWPNHARVRYFQAVSTTFERGIEYYLHMSRDLLRPSFVYQNDLKEYDKLEADVRRYIHTSRTLVDIQTKELSLLPRPIKLYSEIIDDAERLFEMFAEVRVLRFSVPRKATVLDAIPLRRELISAILINLWALSQSFRSRSSLPQYLPSPRIPLEGIMEIVDELARLSRSTRSLRAATGAYSRQNLTSNHEHEEAAPAVEDEGKDELAILYGMAENEALAEVCGILEELVAAARTLFGTRKFLDHPQNLQGFMDV